MATSTRDDYERFVYFCIELVNIANRTKKYEDYTFNTIRHGIHDLRSIYSGFTSIEAIEKFKGRITPMTEEHYNGRANCAREIIEIIRGGGNSVDVKFLVEFVKESCKVHYTTAAENNRLKEFQNKKGYIWQEGYRQAGIKLVRYDGIKTWYQIKGVKYYKTKNELREIFCLSRWNLDLMIEAKGEEIVIP
jgi:hypothetical protein